MVWLAEMLPAKLEEAMQARTIRSFVRREGRMTPAQARALSAHWMRWGVDYAGATCDLDVLFGRCAPRVLEIGFGSGEALLASASADPARDYMGIEVHRPGAGRVLNALAEGQITNVRIWIHDAVEVIRTEIAPASLAEVRIWFPDPWHKKRHHKRRLIQRDFVELVASRLQPCGVLHLATDWSDYATHMLSVMEAAPGWRNLAGPGSAAPRPAWRVATRFEQRGLRLGHGVWDYLYQRVAD